MKRRILVWMGLLMLLSSLVVQGQRASNYGIVRTNTSNLGQDKNGNTIDLSSATNLISNNFTTTNSPLQAIGFNFIFMGRSYTHYVAGNDGQIGLGISTSPTSILSTTAANNLSRASFAYPPSGTEQAPVLAAFWDDLRTAITGATVVNITVGTAPNRCHVVEFNSKIPTGSSTGAADGRFQIRIYETTNQVEYVYGNMAIGSANTVTASIGFSAGSTNGSMLSYTNLTAFDTTTVAASVVNNLVNSSTIGNIAGLHSPTEGSRLSLLFSPVVTVPSAVGAISFSAITGTTATVTWADISLESFYSVETSNDGINWTIAGIVSENSTSFNLTGLTPGSTVFVRVSGGTEGGGFGTPSPVNSFSTTGPAAILSLATGNWNATATWVGGVVPGAGDSVVITAGHTVTLNVSASVNALTVNNGTLQYENIATARTLTVARHVLINASGTLRSAQTPSVTGTAHVLSLGGNLTNNGILDLHRVATTFTSGVGLTFTGASNNTFGGTGATTDIRTLTLNKGTSSAFTLTLNPSVFTIQETTVDGTPMAFLTLTNGTLRVAGTFTMTSRVFTSTTFAIGTSGAGNAGFWLDNPNFTIAGQAGSPTANGTLRISQGTFNIGTAANNSLGFGAGANFIMSGGTLNVAGRFASANAINVTMSAGDINVATVSNTSTTLASFGLTSTSNTYTVSGGNISVVNPNTGATPFHEYIANGTSTPFWNLNLGNNTTAAGVNFRVQGTLPNVFINGTNNYSVSVFATATFAGNLTVGTGKTLINNPSNTSGVFLNVSGGSLTNDGEIQSSSSNCRFMFNGSGLQSIEGSGIFGTIAAPFTRLESSNTGAGINLGQSNNIIATRVNLFDIGGFTNASKITLGNGSSNVTVQFGQTGGTIDVGGFSATPTFNLGTGKYTLSYSREATGATIGGRNEIPVSRSINYLTINSGTNNLTLSGGALTITDSLQFTRGVILTSAANPLVINTANDVYLAGVTDSGYVRGPMRVVFPASLSGLRNFPLPIGTSTQYLPIEYKEVNTTSGGSVTVQVEAFDGPTGGTFGGLFIGINSDNYWQSSIVSGGANLVDARIKITDLIPTIFTASNRLGFSTTQTGIYLPIDGGLDGLGVIGVPVTDLNGFFLAGTAPEFLSAGVYPVGASETLKNLTDITAELGSKVLLGNVIYEIQPDYDGTTEVFPVTFSQLTTSPLSSNYTVTIRLANSLTNVVTTNGASAPTTSMILVGGIDNLTIDGQGRNGSGVPTGVREWTFDMQTNTNNVPTFLFRNDANKNTLTFLNIEGNSQIATSGTVTFASTALINGNDSNTVSNCMIRDAVGGAPGMPFYPVYMLGNTGVGLNNNGNVISNNIIMNYFRNAQISAGVAILGGDVGAIIQGNSIFNEAGFTPTGGTTTSTISGVFLQSPNAISNTISNNFIGGTAPNCGGAPMNIDGGTTNNATAYLIYVEGGTSSANTVSGNTVANISYSAPNSGTTFWAGVNLVTGPVSVTGNTIRNITITPPSSTPGSTITHIIAGSVLGGTVSNNTIRDIEVTPFSTTLILTMNMIGGAPALTSDLTISGNTIGSVSNLSSIANNSGSTNIMAINGINVSMTTVTPGVTVHVTDNTISGIHNNTSATSTSGSTRGINITGATAPSVNVTNNLVQHLRSASGSTGTTTTMSLSGIFNSSTNTSSTFNVTNNTVRSLTTTNSSATTFVSGILSSNSASGLRGTISRNKVHSLNNTSSSATAAIMGIHLVAGPQLVTNNEVRLGIDSLGNSIDSVKAINGILKSNTTSHSYFHNSVYIGGTTTGVTATNTFAFRRTSTGPADSILNNSFVNARSNATTGGKHFSFVLNVVTTNISDNNLYFAPGTGGVLASINGGTADLVTLADLIAAMPTNNLNSISASPNYSAPVAPAGSVSLNPANPTPIESAGSTASAITGQVTLDINGASRSGLTPTDIGAYAGNFAPLDVTPPTITFTPLSNTTSTANPVLSVTISDAISGVPTSGALRPRIWYRNITLSPTWFSAPGTLTSGTANSGTWDFTIDLTSTGLSSILSDNIQYYIVAQDLSSTPNITVSPSVGANHTDVSTQVAAPTTPNNYIVQQTLSGTITVGTGGDVSSLTSIGGAFDLLNGSIVTGNITLSILSNLSETGAIALNELAKDVPSSIYTITISTPTSSVKNITGSLTGSLVKLNGVDYVTINGAVGGSGRFLNFVNNSTVTASATMHIISNGGNGCNNINISNVSFSTGIDPTTSTVTTFGLLIGGTTVTITSTGADNDSITVDNCLFTKARYGLFAIGASSVNPNERLVVTNCTFGPDAFGAEQLVKGGIVLRDQNRPVVSTNVFRHIGGTFATTTGGTDRVAISLGTDATWTPTSTSVTNADISRNEIFNIVDERAFSAVGIIVGSLASPSNNRIVNNVIYGLRSNGTGSDQAVGIGLSALSGDTVAFNSINLSGDLDPAGTTTSTIPSTGLRISSASVVNLTLLNNAISVDFTSNTGTLNHNAYQIPVGYNIGTGAANSNIYFIGSSTQMRNFGIVTTFASSITHTNVLADLQANYSSAQEAGSSISDPLFNSSTVLAPNIGSPAAGAATFLAAISSDFLGATRVNPTSIGAYHAASDIVAPVITNYVIPNTLPTSSYALPSGVTITDIGMGVDGTTNRPRVYFRYNDDANVFGANNSSVSGWKFAEASNTTSPFNFTMDLTKLFGGVVGGKTVEYFYVAQDLNGTPNVSAFPSTGFVGTSVSSITSAPTSPSTFGISASISGLIIVGPGNFPNLTGPTGVFNYLNSNIVVGNVLVEIRQNTIEPGTISLNTISESPVSSNYSIVFRSDNSTPKVLSGDFAGSLVRLDGAKNIRFDGRFGLTENNLIFRNTNTAGSTIAFLNNANADTVTYCTVEGAVTSATNGVVLFGTTASGTVGNDNNVISNNFITNSSSPLLIPANLIASNGSAGAPNTGNRIENNRLSNFSSNGILLSSTGTGNSWVISGNSIYDNQATVATTTQTGINVAAGTAHQVNNNIIGGSAANAGGTPWINNATAIWTGIVLNSPVTTDTIRVMGNEIRNVSITNTTGTVAAFRAISHLGASSVVIGSIAQPNIIGTSSGPATIIASGNAINQPILHNTSAGYVRIQGNRVGFINANGTGTTTRIQGIVSLGTGLTEILNNEVFNLTSTSTRTTLADNGNLPVQGILGGIGATAGQLIIRGNLIYNLSLTTSTAINSGASGIGIGQRATSIEISHNTIYNITNATSGATSVTSGIFIRLLGGAAPLVIANNEISVGQGVTNSTRLAGIFYDGTGGTTVSTVQYNTVFVSGTGSGTLSSYAFQRSSAVTALPVNLRNNAFVNLRTGGSGRHFAIGNNLATPATGWTSSDFNLLLAGDTTSVGEWGTTNRTLTQWRTSSTGDASSRTALVSSLPSPLFPNAATGQLNFTHCIANNGGTPVAETGSITGVTRSASSPDMGAYEYTPTLGVATAPIVSGPINTYQGISGLAYTATGGGAGVTGYSWSFTGAGLTFTGGSAASVTAAVSNTATTGDIQVAAINGCGVGVTTSLNLNVNPAIIWDGTAWVNGTPGPLTSLSSVVIQPGTTATLPDGSVIFDLIIRSGATASIPASTTSTVRGNLTNQGGGLSGTGTIIFDAFSGTATVAGSNTLFSGTAAVASGTTLNIGTLILNDGANLLHGAGTPVGSGSVAGTVLLRRTGTTNSLMYQLWSSPMTSNNLSVVDGPDMYSFNSTTQAWTTVPASTTMLPGIGYAVTGSNTSAAGAPGTSQFSGTPNQGPVTVPLVHNAAGSSWNLVGNPYPSALNGSTFLSTNGGINGAVYLWNTPFSTNPLLNNFSGSDYITFNLLSPPFNLGTAQGFFVEANGTASASFTNSMRSGGSNAFTRTANTVKRAYIRATNNHGDRNVTLVGFTVDATDGYDRLYDARKNKGNANIAFYSQLGNRDLDIQGLAELTATKVVPVGLDAGRAGTYTIAIEQLDNVDAATGIFLQDLQTGLTHNLRQSGFNLNVTAPTNFRNRFNLVFAPMTTNVDPLTSNAQPQVSFTNGQCRVFGLGNAVLQNIDVFDLNGRLVNQFKNLNASGEVTESMNLSEGVYMIKLTTSAGQFSIKMPVIR